MSGREDDFYEEEIEFEAESYEDESYDECSPTVSRNRELFNPVGAGNMP